MRPFKALLFRTAAGGGGGSPVPFSKAFAYTGAGEEFAVPAGITSITVRLWGAAGGAGIYNAAKNSGAGGYVVATFAVTAGDTLRFEIGQGGRSGATGSSPGGAGGWPDGGGGANGDVKGGGGGGSTRFYINGALMAIAGGGGGGAYDGAGDAGAGGGTTGQAAEGNGGEGGTPTSGGRDANDTGNANKTGRDFATHTGTSRTGGWGGSTGDITTSTSDDGGGGGGGWWGGGGGGGDGQPGGGGSSYVDPSATSVTNTAGSRQTPSTTPEQQAYLATGVLNLSRIATAGTTSHGGDGYAEIESAGYSAGPAADLDGHASGGATGGPSSTSATLTTTQAGVIVVFVVAEDPTNTRAVSTVTATGLAFTRRTAITQASDKCFIEEWTAPSPGAQTSLVITATLSGAAEKAGIIAFGVKDVGNTAAPHDVNASLPASNSSSSFAAAPNYSTTHSHDFIFTCTLHTNGNIVETSTWTAIASDVQLSSGGVNWCFAKAFYNRSTKPRANARSPLTLAATSSGPNIRMVDAIKGA